jgi:chemotaxis protein CheX
MKGSIMEVEVGGEILSQIVETVFTNMMGIDVSRCESAWVADPDRLTSAVGMSGEWNGTLVFQCTPWQACRFAGRLLSETPPLVVDNGVRDVVGELANMIGGNMKACVTSGLKLSLPFVTDGSDPGPGTRGATLQERLAFQCTYGHFWVTLLRRAA